MSRSLATRYRKLRRQFGLSPAPEEVRVEDRIGEGARSQTIPTNVFHTVKSRLTHPMHQRSIEAFRNRNPGFSFRVFDDQATDDYMRQEWSEHPIFDVYRKALIGQLRADIFRYCIVFDRGGYYFDFNKSSETPLTELHSPVSEALITYERNVSLFPAPSEIRSVLDDPLRNVVQWGFGFRPRHGILGQAIDRIVELAPYFENQVFAFPKEAVLALSGPGLFTDAVRSWALSHGVEGITQAGVEFGNTGPFRLRGARITQRRSLHYSELRNAPILTSESP